MLRLSMRHASYWTRSESTSLDRANRASDQHHADIVRRSRVASYPVRPTSETHAAALLCGLQATGARSHPVRGACPDASGASETGGTRFRAGHSGRVGQLRQHPPEVCRDRSVEP